MPQKIWKIWWSVFRKKIDQIEEGDPVVLGTFQLKIFSTQPNYYYSRPNSVSWFAPLGIQWIKWQKIQKYLFCSLLDDWNKHDFTSRKWELKEARTYIYFFITFKVSLIYGSNTFCPIILILFHSQFTEINVWWNILIPFSRTIIASNVADIQTSLLNICIVMVLLY